MCYLLVTSGTPWTPLLLQLSAQAAGSSAQLTPPPEAERDQQTLPKLPAVIQLISENYFSHRKRKQQDEDDIMVCHCPPPWRGGDGCGPNCINRMLCIECTEVSSLLLCSGNSLTLVHVWLCAGKAIAVAGCGS